MDELRGPNIQIVLHIKEGIGFGFLKTPFLVSGSLNGYMLETDSTVPCHAPVFDAELVWEADKRKFRSLRVQNVPVKIEVFAQGSQGRKDKIGYLLLSLLGAQPCPANKTVEVKHSWHRLLGIKSAGKCCHPQLLMSLTVEDRINMLTPRNELRMFHSNEIAHLVNAGTNPPMGKNLLMTINEYKAASKKTVSSPDLEPKLLCEEGLIQIGSGRHLFVLSFIIGSVENLDLLIPDTINEAVDCYISYSVFTHNITTDGVCSVLSDAGWSALFNQRTSLRVRSTLATLARYFSECPHLVVNVNAAEKEVGICSMDLRKLIPTEDIYHFLSDFCNADKTLTINERCFILHCEETRRKDDGRRPYMDVEMSLKYVGEKNESVKPQNLTARSATQLKHKEDITKEACCLEFRSGSCAHLDSDVGGVAYTHTAASSTARYNKASGDTMPQTNDLADLIKRMCNTFAQSQEMMLTKSKTCTSDVQIQCDKVQGETNDCDNENSAPIKLQTSKSDTCIGQHEKDEIKAAIPQPERDSIMQKFVDELEDWKERQQQLYKVQLKRKEDYHLEMLSREWTKKRVELESKLSKGIEQCRHLATQLSAATDDFRLRGYRNTEREKKLLEAKKALEAHYTAKYQELREASQKMEDDMNHQLKIKDMRIDELETRIAYLEKQNENLKNDIKNVEKDTESRYSGLTKDQTASLIQELRNLEEKLQTAVQSKSFFKEQWGRAVRELHAARLRARRDALERLQHHRSDLRLDSVEDIGEVEPNEADINKLKDDFYVDILVNTPALDTQSMSTSVPDVTGGDVFDEIKKWKSPMNDKLNELISQRDALVQKENPNEDLLKQLNHDIRSMLLNCTT